MKTVTYPTTMEKETEKAAIKKLLFVAGLSALIMFLPFIIADGGRFSLISDFNFQQIPFNTHANWAIKNGQIGWDWYTDLGVNFIGAFSFYNLGSPFFWLSLLFPQEAFPYLIGWFYMLKYVTAALCAYFWIRTHVKDPDHAVIGAMLYAFSGFAHVNLQFYHFHEVIAFFPLLLLALDRLVKEGRKGWFALATGFMALLNYFFFFGQILFLILYFFTVYRFESRQQQREKLITVLTEGILGVMAAAVLLLPSALFIIFSPKTGSMMSLQDFFLFSKERYLTIFKALVFPAEGMPTQSALFLFDYSSASLYLPALGISMALAGLRGSKYQRLLPLLFIIALIPILNGSFALFNSLYYARWFYMPLLIMAALSARAMERSEPAQTIRAVQFTLLLTMVFIVLVYYLGQSGQIYFMRDHFLISTALALSGLTLTWLLFLQAGRTKAFEADTAASTQTKPACQNNTLQSRSMNPKRAGQQILALVTVFSVVTGVYTLIQTRNHDSEETQAFAHGYLFRTAELEFGDDEEDFRFYTSEPAWNLSLLNRVPSVNSFITTNSPSTYEFFSTVGIRHIPTSLFPEDVNDILTFLSTRYRLDTEPNSDWTPLYTGNNGYQTIHVSENPHFIPMGFPLDHYIYKSELMNLPVNQRAKVLMDALVIPDEETPPEHLTHYDQAAFNRSVEAIAQGKEDRTAENFKRDSNGFTAEYSGSEETTLLFTVPADQGWKAKIDGKAVSYDKSLGFLTILVPPGNHDIEFTYRIPGLIWGGILSLLGSGLIFLRIRPLRRKTAEIKPMDSPLTINDLP